MRKYINIMTLQKAGLTEDEQQQMENTTPNTTKPKESIRRKVVGGPYKMKNNREGEGNQIRKP